jgi:DNA-binding NarL/FixJ family response regulator
MGSHLTVHVASDTLATSKHAITGVGCKLRREVDRRLRLGSVVHTTEHVSARPTGVGPRVFIDVDDDVLVLALKHVVVELGLHPVANRGSASCIVASRILTHPPHTDILVVEHSPFPAAAALAALRAGGVRAIMSAREPKQLPQMLEALGLSLCVIGTGIIGLANQLPLLTLRQHKIMSLMCSDRHYKHLTLAHRLGVSIATVKRDIRELCDRLHAADSHELAARARSLGYASGESMLDAVYSSHACTIYPDHPAATLS